MLKKKRGKPRVKNQNKEPGGISRREFLQDARLAIGGAALGYMVLLSACTKSEDSATRTTTVPTMSGAIYSPDIQRTNRIPPGQRETGEWPVLQIYQSSHVDPSEWMFNVSGLVDNELELSYAEFMEIPRVKVLSDIHCVTTWTRLNNLWEGPSSQTIIDLANPKPEVKYVIVKATGGYTANLTLSDFMETDVIFAIKHDNKPLTPEHGAPVRLVVPRLYFWKSAKWVTGLEFTEEDKPGYWESRGYHNHGDPWKEERYQR
jgi:DMSO/TMAO reductase YedYZ molybdopterin-dependent catalytic subunit